MENFNPKFQVGDFVFLVTDPEQFKRVITGILLRKNGIEYEVSLGADAPVYANDFELSKEKDLKIS